MRSPGSAAHADCLLAVCMHYLPLAIKAAAPATFITAQACGIIACAKVLGSASTQYLNMMELGG